MYAVICGHHWTSTPCLHGRVPAFLISQEGDETVDKEVLESPSEALRCWYTGEPLEFCVGRNHALFDKTIGMARQFADQCGTQLDT